MTKTIAKHNSLYTMVLRSDRFPEVFVRQTRLVSIEAARDCAECFKSYLVELEEEHDLKLGRHNLNAVREACEALQSMHPNIYLLDEQISVENAQDGRVQDGHRRFSNEYEAYWTADECREVARHMVADTATRCAEQGIDCSEYGISL